MCSTRTTRWCTRAISCAGSRRGGDCGTSTGICSTRAISCAGARMGMVFGIICKKVVVSCTRGSLKGVNAKEWACNIFITRVCVTWARGRTTVFKGTGASFTGTGVLNSRDSSVRGVIRGKGSSTTREEGYCTRATGLATRRAVRESFLTRAGLCGTRVVFCGTRSTGTVC